MARIDWKSIRIHPDQQDRFGELMERIHDAGEVPRKRDGKANVVGCFTWMLQQTEEVISQIERESPGLIPREESPI